MNYLSLTNFFMKSVLLIIIFHKMYFEVTIFKNIIKMIMSMKIINIIFNVTIIIFIYL